MPLHPEVQKYIKQTTSKAGKARWNSMTDDQKKAHMRKMNMASVKSKKEQKRRAFKEQFYD